MVEVNPYAHVDVDADAGRRKIRTRRLILIAIVAAFLVGIITYVAVSVAYVRTPNFRLRSASFGTIDVTTTTNASFNIVMNAELAVRNRNFRRFRYRSTTVDFYYRNQKVGEASVWRARAKARDTRRFVVPVILSSRNITSSPELQSDLNNGVLPLRSRSRLTGRVKIMVFIRRYKHANMDCTMDLVIANRQLRNISCR